MVRTLPALHSASQIIVARDYRPFCVRVILGMLVAP